ncbi:hypothetical protein HPC49_16880 [Pyxidicoccus fallax]|uniref:DUF4279 domain-containing protein n=1 Tax=Pyxidicoccus fallax TaxID=394095 RepID=A0A848LMX0_9BACT|nr:hypothetical protein [Pyxidicoccus fallax]NMO19207.1 hypothetical protein [Pyxidicoccus fallax]NPC79890.1 hypothetical protein [Pyxidicoccus fallax]
MIVGVLRVSSPAFDVKAFLTRFPGLEPETVWRRGEPRQPRGEHADSGFHRTIVEAETGGEAVAEASRALTAMGPALEELRRLAVPCVVDFGMFIGGARRFTGSLALSPGDLRWFAEQGVGVTVSAYPASDEEDAEPASH